MVRRSFISLARWSRERREGLDDAGEPEPEVEVPPVLVLPERPSLQALTRQEDEVEAPARLPGAA